jgi:hypothetical protein
MVGDGHPFWPPTERGTESVVVAGLIAVVLVHERARWGRGAVWSELGKAMSLVEDGSTG